MNIQAIKDGLTIAGDVIDTLRSAKDKLPAGKKKPEMERLLESAAEKLKEAESRIGHELGFPICKRCWPPEIMVHNEDGEFICRGCGKAMPDGMSADVPNADDLSTW
jgi:hypothetical protein